MLLAQSLAVVTGVDCAIGDAVACSLVEAGADTVLVSAQGPESELTVDHEGHRRINLSYDPADAAATVRATERIVSVMGREPSILVNLTGFSRGPYRPLWEMPIDSYDAEFAGGLRASFLFMKQFMPGMVTNGDGRVINVGRVDGHRGAEGQSVAGSLGWALRGLTRSAALEAGEFGVTVNLVACGPLAAEVMPQKTRDAIAVGPALRRCVTGLDVASAVIFLASGMGQSMTGQELVIDGGIIV